MSQTKAERLSPLRENRRAGKLFPHRAPAANQKSFCVRGKDIIMFCGNGNGNCCLWIIIILIILFACGGNGGCGCGCGCNNCGCNNCGCNDNCGNNCGCGC